MPVTLQVGLTPGDLEEATHLLPHQLRQWAGQVDEVLCTIDCPPPSMSASGMVPEPPTNLCQFIETLIPAFPNLRWAQVNYSPTALAEVAAVFYGGRPVPLQDHRQRPVYAFLFALMAPSNDLVFHIDSDMLFGGGSQTWIQEAVEILGRYPDVLTCSPLPGPPRADRRLLSQRDEPVHEPHPSPAYRFPTLSTRYFLLDRRKLVQDLSPLRAEWPPLRPTLRSLLNRRRPHDILERVISRAMQRRGLFRVDFLGADPGMWTIHPLIRSARFRGALPELIRRVEAGEVPEAQRGEYDLSEEMLTSAEVVGSGKL